MNTDYEQLRRLGEQKLTEDYGETWRILDEHTLFVKLDDGLRLTEHGLIFALRKVPLSERRHWSSFAWLGERCEYGERWGLISVEAR